MVIDDGAGEGDIDPALDGVLVVINATTREITQRLDTQVGHLFTLCDAQAQGTNPFSLSSRPIVLDLWLADSSTDSVVFGNWCGQRCGSILFADKIDT